MGETAARELEWTASVGLRRRAGLGEGAGNVSDGLGRDTGAGRGPRSGWYSQSAGTVTTP